MQVIPYLNYKGNATDAIELYKKALEGEVTMMLTFKDFGDTAKEYPDYVDQIAHAEMKVGDGKIYFCDTLPDRDCISGTQIDVHLDVDSMEFLNKAFDTLKAEGTVNAEPFDSEWGSCYCSVTDKFGVRWGFNYQYPQK